MPNYLGFSSWAKNQMIIVPWAQSTTFLLTLSDLNRDIKKIPTHEGYINTFD